MVSSSAPVENAKPMQQRAAAAAQALLPVRSISQRDIQTMLEKNEAALKGWNALHKQQPAKTSPAEHQVWVRRCLDYRQQVGARLEVLASLADKQIAQEDDKQGSSQVSVHAAAVRQGKKVQNRSVAISNPALSPPQAMARSQQGYYLPPQVSTMSSRNTMAHTAETSIESPIASTRASMAMPTMAAPMMFSESPMPTVEFAPTNSNTFFPMEPIASMQASSGFHSTTTTSGYAMCSGVQTYTPNTYMTATSGSLSSSALNMGRQHYMTGGNTIHFQPFMPMSMPLNLAGPGSENGFYHYDMASVSNKANTGIDGNNNGTNSFAMDPFMTPLGFGTDTGFGSTGFSMSNMPSMSYQQQQMMGSLNGSNFGVQEASMVPSSFGHGGMAPSSSMMPQSILDQSFQPTPHLYHQQTQFSQQHHPVGSMTMSPDSSIYGDSNVNIFEGLTDDAFFPMQ